MSEHGTINRYNAYGCRCDLCKAAKSVLGKKYYKSYERPVNTFAEHGTITRYTGGRCRCEKCKARMSKYHRERLADPNVPARVRRKK